ncbi:MAG TPA: Holliday junction branch migration DNA helicase RuvB, partial [Clostridiales bacterium UBA8960]|nr:Holliday junction branch migration DNA helicase RuvB [Clostridiales bacterium UBA8960]
MERFITPKLTEEDVHSEHGIRPRLISEYVGQEKTK